MRWFTSDLHLGDDWAASMRWCKGDVPKMHEQLSSRWDTRIGDDDEVWVLGDIFFPELFSADDFTLWLADRPGRKYLVMGNHDTPLYEDTGIWLDHGFEAVWAEDNHPPLIQLDDDVSALLSHYPTTISPSGLLLHGHTHRYEKWSRRQDGQINIHVGWEAWRRPVAETEIVQMVHELRSGRLEALARGMGSKG